MTLPSQPGLIAKRSFEDLGVFSRASNVIVVLECYRLGTCFVV